MEQKNEENCINCVMNRIKTEHLTPRSKWRFLFHDYSVLVISASSLVIGTISFSIFLNTVLTDDWDIYPQAGRTFFEHLIKSVPFLWLFFLCAFVMYSYYAFSSSERGYRYKQCVVIALSIGISLVLGMFAFLTGVGEAVDDFLIENIPHYHTITGNHACLWLHPENGLLAGMIVSTGTDPLIIVDFNGNRWIATGTPEIDRGVVKRQGERVKILGRSEGNFVFTATELRRWVGVAEPSPCR
jgi:hypothetical protein